MAIDEINAAGGLLGKKIEPIVEDPESKFTDVFPEKAKKLLLKDKVPVVFGCWTSVSRKNVLPVFEENDGLLFYPVQYEGNESSKNVVYTGAAPNQQILPAVEWLLSKAGGEKKKFYLLGSDYIFPRTANLIIVKYLESKGMKPVAEKYTPLGHLEYQNIVQDIKKEDPDVIFSTINGDSNVNFYNELAAQGITADKCPVVAVSVGEDELRGLDPAKVKGHLAAWNYFQSIDTPVNKEFVKKFKEKYGKPTASPTTRSRRPTSGSTSGSWPSKRPGPPTWTRCARPSCMAAATASSSTPPRARSGSTRRRSTPTSTSAWARSATTSSSTSSTPPTSSPPTPTRRSPSRVGTSIGRRAA